MAERSVIIGRVVDMTSGAGIAGLRIEALDQSGAFFDLLGFTRTDEDGRFRMEALTKDVQALVGNRLVIASLRVIQQPNPGAAPYYLLADTIQFGPTWPLHGGATEVTIRVDPSRILSALSSLLPFVVSGTVYGNDGPIEGVTVRLNERDPYTGDADLLTSTTTDARGRYRLTYTPPANKDSRDIFVRVDGSPDTDSEHRCHAPPSMRVDVTRAGEVWRGPSTHARITDALVAAGVDAEDIQDLTDEQCERLACSLRLPEDDIRALSTAHSIAAASSALMGEARETFAEVAFAALSLGLGFDRDSLFQHPKSAVRTALREAVESNLVSQAYANTDTLDTALERWVTAAAEWSLETRADPCGLGELLTVAGVTASGDRTSFAEQLCANEAAMPDFWDGLTGTFDKGRLQLTFQWWSLTRGHLPLIEKLEELRDNSEAVTLADLAKLSDSEWDSLLGDISEATPPSFPGENETEKRENYKNFLYRTMAEAFPTVHFRARADANPSELSGVKTFLNDSEINFELGKKRLSHSTYTVALANLEPEERSRLKAIERLARFVPTYDLVDVLITKGYSSAHAMHGKGKDKFIEEMQGTPVQHVAAVVYQKACWQVRAASIVHAQHGHVAEKHQIKVFANFSEVSTASGIDTADWQTLFGNAGGCHCKHCAGVLGPAAYLADSLQWLDSFDSTLPKAGAIKWSALDVLVGSDEDGTDPPLGRRPDLKLLELTCKSAHTPQPYIDLTNELLEIAVANKVGPTVSLGASIKTTHEPEELAAGPEILYEVPHIRAWRALMQRRHPFTLPVCLFDKEAEAYLRYLGVTRAEIVETLGGVGDDLAKARLGVRADWGTPPDEPAFVSGWGLLVGTDGGTAAEQWGLDDLDDVEDTSSLSHVPLFLRQSGLTFTELEELLATRYVNGVDGNGAVGLDPLALVENGKCDIATMTISGLSDPHLLRIHRFLRLRLHTGLSSTDLDILLAAFPSHPTPGQIDAQVLRRLTEALVLARELNLKPREVAALFANLDIHERWEKKSPYRQYFLNRLVDNPVPADLEAVLTDPAAVADLSLHSTALQQALGISRSELSLLVDLDALPRELLLPSGDRVLGTYGTTTEVLPSVSQLWRHVRFARALGLKLADYLVLRAYSGEDPIGVGLPERAMAFVELVRAFRSQALTVPELQWVLRAFATRGASAPNNADLEALEAEITGAVGVIVSETASSEDAADAGAGAPADSPTRASALLGELLEPSQRDAVLVILRGSDTPPPDNSWGDPIADIQPYLPEGARDLLAGHFEGATWHPPLLASAAERFAHVSMWLDRHIRASRAVVEKVAAAANLPVATAAYLMTSILPRQGTHVPEAFLIDDFLPLNRTQSSVEDRVRGLALLLRHARLIRGLRIGEPIPASNDAPESPGEVSWIYEPSSGGLHALPAEQPSTAILHEDDRTRFAKILQVARRVGLRDRMKGGAGALRELLQAAPPDFNDAVSLLADKSGWEHDTLVSLCTHAGIATTAGLLADDTLLQLEKRVSLVRRLGIAVDRVLAFYELESPPPPAEPNGLQPTTEGPPNARDLVIYARHAAKAKLSAEEWAAVAKKVRDPFRELLRDRLVDALVPSTHDTRDELYGHHLIDVDMSPCMMTSRVVQATNALQVFVQRSFLGLDGDVKLPPKAAQQWEWRKAYRLWEANRKVFLWPENWLEPDLRDDMTPLFKQFLTNLASGEITDASAERALEKYLSGLHEIARLEPMGLWYDSESKTDHVIARTRSQPRKWFYRRREDAAWTPWEKMDVDIDAESVLLVGANRRLYLFWPQLTLKNDRPPVEGQQQLTYLPHPGPPPVYEFGEDPLVHAQRFVDWQGKVKDWGDNQSPQDGAGGTTQAPEPTQHYQVRVAWSSYLDGAWTPKRMSDCDPIKIANARGDRDNGREPKDIVLTLEPRDVPPGSGILYLLCVVASPPSEKNKNAQAGRFYFDACDGGRWTSRQMEGGVYKPTLPRYTRLSNRGFEWRPGVGPYYVGGVSVQRASAGASNPVVVKLLDNHDGHYFIISPSSHKTKPTHAFERFLYADYKVVFHARARSRGAALAESGQLVTDQLWANLLPSGGAAAEPGSQPSIQLHVPQESTERYVLELFEHPYVCEFANCLAEKGISGLLGWKNNPQASAQYLHNGDDLKNLYDPTENVAEPFPKHDVSFDFGSAYGQYNWELFFHVPFTIAQRLSQEGRYAEAQKWFHHIFNPTTGLTAGGPKRFWCVKPFYEIDDLSTIGESLSALAAASSSAATLQALIDHDEATEKAAADLETQILAMSKKPFSPHALARLRPLAYMKNVFMRYIENILDWGDNLFRRDTMESIHEALTLYLLAADLLGPRPQIIEHKADPAGKTFKELLTDGLDSFGNAAVEVENIVPKIPPPGFECTDDGPPMPDFRLYFCVPPNEQLYGLWDTVADRLFKIRNCMNIEGVARSLPLFAPPIDPAILVRAAAAGVRLDQVLDALAAPAPLYRFVRLHAKAVEFAGAVQALGQGLLSALEKKDGEELALLRQRHEVTVLDAERDVRKHAIQEAKETLGGLNRSLKTAQTRLVHYTGLLAKGLIPEEKRAEDLTRTAGLLRTISADIEIMGAVAAGIPDTSAGMCSGTTLGGRAVQLAANALGRSTAAAADTLSTSASLAQTAAGHARRAEEWKLQKSLAEKEIAQLEKQIAAQEIRVAIAERELDNLDLRREHSREVDAFYRSKFTSQELYTWMSAQLASEHYRAYQTAYDMAKRAERAYQLERGDETSFVRFGAWDSLKKGLLAGERLLQDLRALDAAYLSRSDREREITKHISLAEVAGEELTRLRDIGSPSGGKAEIELPPYLFDADYPGQYFRRIKNVAITVATVKSAADGVQCELTLLKSAIRKNSKLGTNNSYPSEPYADDESYRFSQAPVKVLATSTAENDPGLFEVNLKDEMLLPVEGSGAISQWRIEIDHRTNRFPMHRISDVVLHLRYTAKDGGNLLREEALTYASRAEQPEDPEAPNGLTQRTRVFSARRDFDEAWRVFTGGQLIATDTWANKLELRFVQSQFRSFFGDPKVKIVRVQVSATFNDKYEPPASAAETVDYELTPPEGDPQEGAIDFRLGEPKQGHDFDTSPVEVPRDDASPQPWVFTVATPPSTASNLRRTPAPHLLHPDVFEDIWFTVTYERRQP